LPFCHKEKSLLSSFADFVDYCRRLRGTALETGARGKLFSVTVEGNTVYFIPKSSGKRRRANAEKTERVLKQLTGTSTWAPGDYQAITYHASYILAVARHWLDNRK
jgi:hypothetical protein